MPPGCPITLAHRGCSPRAAQGPGNAHLTSTAVIPNETGPSRRSADPGWQPIVEVARVNAPRNLQALSAGKRRNL